MCGSSRLVFRKHWPRSACSVRTIADPGVPLSRALLGLHRKLRLRIVRFLPQRGQPEIGRQDAAANRDCQDGYNENTGREGATPLAQITPGKATSIDCWLKKLSSICRTAR